MAAGHPLTDEDRWPWLDTIAAWIDERVAAGEPAVVTCSALKKIYRDKLRRQGVVFVFCFNVCSTGSAVFFRSVG